MMRKQFIRSLIISGIATGLISCAGTPAATSQPTAVATVANLQPTPQPTVDVGALVATPDTAASGSMAAAVSGTGEIKTLNDADLNFQVTGTVAQILVKEGDSIKKDTLIATLDTAIYDQQVAQAQANLVSAKATLAGFQADGPDSRAAQAQLAQAQATFDATKPGATSADIEASQLSLNAAKLNLKSTGDRLSLAKTQAQLQLDLASQTVAQAAVNRLTVQRAQAEAGVAQAEASLTLANLNRQRAEIRAPFDGVVSFINISVGDPANLAGRAPVQLIDAVNLQAEVQISDVDIGGVTLNQGATVSVDAMPGKQYPGVVTFISPVATVVGNARLYTVHIKLTDIAGLRAGMSARISLNGK